MDRPWNMVVNIALYGIVFFILSLFRTRKFTPASCKSYPEPRKQRLAPRNQRPAPRILEQLGNSPASHIPNPANNAPHPASTPRTPQSMPLTPQSTPRIPHILKKSEKIWLCCVTRKALIAAIQQLFSTTSGF